MHLAGAVLDDILLYIGGTTLFSDNVESGDDNGWVPAGDGFKRSSGTETSDGDRYYLVENRTYTDYDATLEVGPYQFSNGLTAPDLVEHFPYQDGMLVWVVDEAYGDNNTIEHRGHGLALPVDSHAALFTYEGETTGPSNRRQPFDATFGLQTIDPVTLHKEVVVGKGKSQTITSVGATAPGGQQLATFSDADVDAYFDATNPLGGVYVAGRRIRRLH